jgi:hypothetical protein
MFACLPAQISPCWLQPFLLSPASQQSRSQSFIVQQRHVRLPSPGWLGHLLPGALVCWLWGGLRFGAFFSGCFCFLKRWGWALGGKLLRLFALALLPFLNQRGGHLDDLLKMASLFWRQGWRQRR